MSENKELEKIREEIDGLDSKLLSLLNRRLRLAKKAGIAKKDKVIYRPEREADIYRKLKKSNKGPLIDEQIVDIFKEIISSCRATEEEIDVAFLGPEGTFSDSAVKMKLGSSVNRNPRGTIQEVFKEVEQKKSHYGIVPIENSTEGPINVTLDCLASSSVKICGEVEMKIHHSLMGLNRALPKDNFEIHAHEQTLAQCKDWLDSYCPNVKKVIVSSNAQAALDASKQKKVLAIAGSLAAEKYGLDIIKECIEDYSGNTTRFITIGLHEVESTGEDKTSLLITTKNEPGALYNALKPFERNNLNLTHITYRPSKTHKWNYSFFFDFEGHKQEKNVRVLLKELGEIEVEVKILGSYPKAEG
tara:strand:+ start:124 stop:1200 length:1077 start_codon:yes stop_codon:yes gene_type:complete